MRGSRAIPVTCGAALAALAVLACGEPRTEDATEVLSEVRAGTDLPEQPEGSDDAEGRIAFPAPPGSAGLAASVQDGRLFVREPDGSVVAAYDLADEPGDLVHAAVRRGEHPRATVIALFRTDEPELGVTYDLRYLVVDGEDVSELFWFPWRLQVHAELAEVVDVPPVPVWSPTGDAVAWVEWSGDGTRLRIVGWTDDDVSSNPTDDGVAVALEDVPAGTQLDAWQPGSPGMLVGLTLEGVQVAIEIPGW